MFESLSDRLQAVFRSLARHGKLREEDVDAALAEIRLALLEADVHYQVVRDLLARVRLQALGEEISRALNPTQQVIRVLHAELVAILGEPGRLKLKGERPRVVLLVGLQGSGKTTTAIKLARHLKHQGERVWLAAADIYRPAAVDQLQIMARDVDVPVFFEPELSPPALAAAAVEAAKRSSASVLIIDAAGRSQLDAPMMEEIRAIAEAVQPTETLLVADAMTGQEALNVARGFLEKVEISGLILTKMDGDARGGAAISMRSVTGVPIKFIGTGEGREALEPFQPDRLVSRILGMGDVLSLIEKAESALDKERARSQVEKLRKGEDLTLDDFAEQLDQLKALGPLGKVLEMLPGGMKVGDVNTGAAELQLRRTRAILSSMTPVERKRPRVLDASRKRRIAAGSGTMVQDVNQLLRQYNQMKKVFQQVRKRGMKGIRPMLG